MFHYVYRTELIGSSDFYVGVRSSHTRPELDEYFGSGHWIQWIIRDKSRLKKVIVREFERREDAEIFELDLVAESLRLPNCRNLRVQRYNMGASRVARESRACT